MEMTADLLTRARGGDADAFRALTDPHRRELHVHCYRMLGSFQDAEDALQETWLAAWRGLAGYRESASIRTWLYRIATNTCLNARRAASRRPPQEWNVPGVDPPEPTGLGEVVWLEPYPVERAEDLSLAFVTALQTLPPRQVAVLILRDVLDFHASEVAEMLDSSVASVNSALKRARAGMERRRRVVAVPASEEAIVAKFVSAYEAADLDAVVALLTDDVFISMPPMPFEYTGLEVVARFCGGIFGSGRRFDLVPTRANGQPAFGTYLRGPGGISHGVGLIVLEVGEAGISAMTRFEKSVLASFGLPRSIATPSRRGSPR
jgi:RNA polymerase sigma-70 factor (TIGR02960 family)